MKEKLKTNPRFKGNQKIEYNDHMPQAEEIKAPKPKDAYERKMGLLGKILETGKKFIKDDIKDEDFLK